jgi:hypothetical protein
MPNWCCNELDVSGPEAQLRRFMQRNRGKFTMHDGQAVELPLSFEAVLPTPPALLKCADSWHSWAYDAVHGDFAYMLAWDKCKQASAVTRETIIAVLEAEEPGLRSKADQVKANIEAHGFPDWYGWRVHHWGTKWDLDKDTEVECQERCFVRYRFDTAWSPPDAWLKATAREFPALNFELRYEEGGMGFTGRVRIEDGEVVDDEQRDMWGRQSDECEPAEAYGFISDPESEYA